MSDETASALQGYFDWQVTTVMLALDLVEPLPGDDTQAHQDRRQRVEDQVRAFSLAAIPQQFQDDPELDWTPEVMMALTRATFDQVQAILARAGD